MQTKPVPNRQYTVTVNDDATLLEIGPAAGLFVGLFVLQFQPSWDYQGQFMVLGKLLGEAARSLNMPPLQLPYKRVNLNGIAQDYALVTDPISGPALIQVPCNGMSIVLNTACQVGSCAIAMLDIEGTSAI